MKDGRASFFNERRRHAKPVPNTVFFILLEVVYDSRCLTARQLVFPEVPLDDRRELESSQLAGPKSVGTVRHLADPIRAWLVDIALRDVGRVEVNHRSSRNSD